MPFRGSPRELIRRVSPSSSLESDPASWWQRSLRLPTLGGSQQEGRKEEGIPPAEAAHHDVSAGHPEAARKADSRPAYATELDPRFRNRISRIQLSSGQMALVTLVHGSSAVVPVYIPTLSMYGEAVICLHFC